jgi:hypothetical protein
MGYKVFGWFLVAAVWSATVGAESVVRGGGGRTEPSTYAARPQMRDFLAEVRRDAFLRDAMRPNTALDRFSFHRFTREYGKYPLFNGEKSTGSVSMAEMGSATTKPGTVAETLLRRMGPQGDLTNVATFAELFGTKDRPSDFGSGFADVVVRGNAAIFAELPGLGPQGERVKQDAAAVRNYSTAAADTLVPGGRAFGDMLANAEARGEVGAKPKLSAEEYAAAAKFAVGEFMQLLGENADLLAKNGVDVAERALGVLAMVARGGVEEVTFQANTLLANIKALKEAEGTAPGRARVATGDHALVSTSAGSGGAGAAGPIASANAIRVEKGATVYGRIVRSSNSPAEIQDKLAVQFLKNMGVLDYTKATKEQARQVKDNVKNFCDECAKSCKMGGGAAGGPIMNTLARIAAG